jgi:plasmid maintenance system antidote protein VapI
VEAKRRRCIPQDDLAGLVGVSRPTLANILAGRFGASPQTAARIAEVIATTPAFERQPFLPGLAA